MTIVVCSKGYPGNYKKNKVLNLSKVKNKKNSFLIHAGTKKKENKIYTNGGRVLNIVSLGNNYKKIRNNIFQTIKKIN